jgi:hypothetical protein
MNPDRHSPPKGILLHCPAKNPQAGDRFSRGGRGESGQESGDPGGGQRQGRAAQTFPRQLFSIEVHPAKTVHLGVKKAGTDE